jgi:hypothetical protein
MKIRTISRYNVLRKGDLPVGIWYGIFQAVPSLGRDRVLAGNAETEQKHPDSERGERDAISSQESRTKNEKG